MTKKRIFRLISLLLLALFSCYQFQTIRYTHIHMVGDKYVVHIHPFSKSSAEQHTHTYDDLASIDLLMFHFALPLLFFSIPLFLRYKKYIVPSIRSKTQTADGHIAPYRGPPVFKPLF